MVRFLLTGLIVFGGAGGSVALAQSSVPTAMPFPSSTPVPTHRMKHSVTAAPTPAASASASAGARPVPAKSTPPLSAQPSPAP